ILLNSALLFSTALFSRSAIMTYICGLLLYMLYMVASMLGNSPLMAQSTPVSPENAALSALLEPYGLIGFYEQTRYWTVFEKNTQQVALTGTFLFNRMFWTGLSLILFAATYRVFAFRSVRIKHAKTTEGSAFIGELLPYRTVMPDFREKFIDIAALFSKIKIEYISVIKGLPFIVIAISMVFIVGIEISQQLGRGIYTVPFYPSTGLIVPNIQEIISKVGFFIILFYAAELYWNERSVKINELVDTSPAKSITFYLSKLAVLATIISTLIFISIAVSIAYQLFRGYFELRLDLYLSLFLYSGYGLLLDAILALFLQNFVKNKYLGIGLSFLVFSYAVILSKMGVPMHELSSYGHMPEFIFSDMADFVFYGQAEKWYLLYWTGIAIILVSISLLIWKRGYGRKINGLGSTDYYLPVIGLLIAIYAGSYVYYQADIVNERMNQTERLDFSERYEKKYYQYADLAQPTISSVNLQVDLYPEQRRYDVNGYYMLTNKSSEPIDRILIGIRKQNALTAEIA
ncbi:MAG: hypothetical protein KDD94_15380, partial [Calditrichaeota bacterium]|nr:hypothetical protein [Calditrichota bacterium]